jgi:8-oxoguanine deaminase
VQSIDEILADSERVIATYHDPEPGAMIQVALAPCSPFSVTPQLMRESAELARRHGVRLHTHIAETLDEDAYSRDTFGMSPVELLGSLNWLSPDVWVAHCVHPSQGDMESMASTQTSVAHCPTSNMLLGSGLAPIREFLEVGVAVGIGVDGSASNDANDMRQEMKQTVLVARVRDGAGAMDVRHAVRLATRGGAAALGRDDIGSIEAGKAADLALFDITRLECAGGQEDPLAAIVLGATRPETVLVNGEMVVDGRCLANHDQQTLADQLNAASRRLLERARVH